MKKLKLNLAQEAGEILSREELKKVLGGTGSGSGIGSGSGSGNYLDEYDTSRCNVFCTSDRDCETSGKPSYCSRCIPLPNWTGSTCA